jgi:hypothetical protein
MARKGRTMRPRPRRLLTPVRRRPSGYGQLSAGTHRFKSSWPDRLGCLPIHPAGKELIPDLTPVRPTLTLTLELSADFTHASAALWANAIQNARHHSGTGLGCIYSNEPHTRLRLDELSTVLNAFPVPKLQSHENRKIRVVNQRTQALRVDRTDIYRFQRIRARRSSRTADIDVRRGTKI